MRKFQLSAICILTAIGALQAQYVSPERSFLPDSVGIGQPAAEIDSATLTNLTVIEPQALTARIERHRMQAVEARRSAELNDSLPVGEAGERHKINGFRVQVFSDNNQKTSQREAKAKELKINERFPEYETYIVYNSPYWRLKVGDFRTEFDAEAAADEIKRAFPEFAREVRIVRDRVSVAR